MRTIFALGFIVGFLHSPVSLAQMGTGDFYLESCALYIRALDEEATNIDHLKAATCMGFVTGSSGMMRIWQEAGDALLTCIPYEVSDIQMTRIFLQYLQEHPEKLHELASALFLFAVGEAFPCSE